MSLSSSRRSRSDDETADLERILERRGLRHEFVHVRGLRFHLARVHPSHSNAMEDEPALPLLFLHGFPEFWYSWRHQLAFFGGRHDCIAPDLRGYGETDKPAGGYDLDSLADDIAALIGALGYERVVVIAHDWGAAIAWHLAARAPERVERLVILDCPPADVLRKHLLTNPRQLRRSGYIFAFQLPGIERKLAAQDAALIRRALVSSTCRPAFSPSELDRYAAAILRPGVLPAALAYYRTVFRDALWPGRARRITDPGPICVPTLVLWGKDDPALGCELTHGLEQRCVAGLTLRFFDQCGHFIQQELPSEVNAAIDLFLRNA